ncbi:glucosamine 6-phosphate N-acetyltransferase-like [Mytilus galloprovincialis]|uniref:Glucosamine 6-phosphate N-acetyltransferase n=1 Tax=Mytilus edulis TaxID=6550 RepID=A0A8S3TVH1_MYTED|nr:GNA1 [Mytilus edulis]
MTTNDKQANGVEDEPLFDPSILRELDFEHKSRATYNPNISPQNPGEMLKLRPLYKSDYDKGYMNLLSQLTKVGNVSREEFEARFNDLKGCGDTYYIVVIEDMSLNQVIGTGSLVKERKFLRQCASRGRIEDIVVNNAYRGKQLGKLLLDVLTILCQKIDCYKLSLECLDGMVKFYKQFGFDKEDGQNYMVQRFHD